MTTANPRPNLGENRVVFVVDKAKIKNACCGIGLAGQQSRQQKPTWAEVLRCSMYHPIKHLKTVSTSPTSENRTGQCPTRVHDDDDYDNNDEYFDGEIDGVCVCDITLFKYARLTSYGVERSFSQYKSLFRDSRHAFVMENLEMTFVVHCNSRPTTSTQVWWGGISSFKCAKCVSAAKAVHGDNTPVKPNNKAEKKIISPTIKLDLPNLQCAESLSVQVDTVRLNSVTILDTVTVILEHVKNLSIVNPVTKSYSSVLSDTVKSRNHAKSAPSSSFPLTQHNSNEVISAVVRSDDITVALSNNVDFDGFQTVTRKKFKKRDPKVGTITTSNLEMTLERIRTKSLFVSRFSPNVNENNIKDSLFNQLKLRSLEITKLKTKYQSYSSFHISGDERDFELIILMSGLLDASLHPLNLSSILLH
ncbi:hypothetical protein ANN_21516 [Periplaneta americana]|uniref:Uncharacterized protein n=1 Tax=Periplaneta americana TaxID=6978 RepID=A0ABQ8SGR6_PERAM|nr:hypothetical protein ANN_21516 [Periplaneta americana]